MFFNEAEGRGGLHALRTTRVAVNAISFFVHSAIDR